MWTFVAPCGSLCTSAYLCIPLYIARYDLDHDVASVEAKKSNDSLQSGDSDGAIDGSQSEQSLVQLLKELRQERDALQGAYEQVGICKES